MPQRRSRHEVPAPSSSTRDLARIGAGMMAGDLNVSRTIVLAAYTSETTILDADMAPTRAAHLSPRSAAAADLKWWVSAKGRGSVTISHDEPGADAEFDMTLIG